MFEEMNEQVIATKMIKNAIKNDRLAHAYIIETNGYEKGYDFALSFAKLLLCKSYNNVNPNCNNCMQCLTIDENNYPELKIIEPDGSWIKKEQLLELQEEFNKKSIIGSRKVYIINKADKLNQSSANTILKFLEEPQEGIIAILVTNNSYQLIETIVSRCQVISLNGRIKKGNNVVEKLGILLFNNTTDYEEFVNNNTSLEKIENVLKFIEQIEKNKLKTIVYTNQYFFDFFPKKEDIEFALFIMIYFYKDVLNYKINVSIKLFNEYEDIIVKIAESNPVKEILNKINVLNESRKNLDYNANLNLLIDRLIIEMQVRN